MKRPNFPGIVKTNPIKPQSSISRFFSAVWSAIRNFFCCCITDSAVPDDDERTYHTPPSETRIYDVRTNCDSFFIYSRTGAPSAHGISSTKSSNELITNKPIQPPATLLRRISSAPTITAAPAAIPLKGKQQTVAKLRSLGAVRVGYPNS